MMRDFRKKTLKMKKKSAKDIALEKERAKFRQQIRDLEREVEKIKSLKLEEVITTKDKEID